MEVAAATTGGRELRLVLAAVVVIAVAHTDDSLLEKNGENRAQINVTHRVYWPF